MLGGHEGAGVIEQIGPGVTDLEVGDHVVFSFLPACGNAYPAWPATRTSAILAPECWEGSHSTAPTGFTPAEKA